MALILNILTGRFCLVLGRALRLSLRPPFLAGLERSLLPLVAPRFPTHSRLRNTVHNRVSFYPASGGFTLVEILAVVGILGVLAMLLLPTVRTAMSSAGGTKCISNLRQIGVASAAYSADHAGAWPPNQAGGPVFANALIPYLGGVPGKNQGDFLQSPLICPNSRTDLPDSNYRYRGIYTPSSDSNAPEKGKYGLSYGLNAYVSGTSESTQVRNLLAVEKPSQMMLYMDIEEHYMATVGGLGLDERKQRLLQRHDGRINVVYADGSVRTLLFDDIPPANSPVRVFWSGRGAK